MGEVCRDCHAPIPEGAEDPEADLMPGVCPLCFEQRVLVAFATARTLPDLVERLIAAGCVPDRITRHLYQQVKLYERRN